MENRTITDLVEDMMENNISLRPVVKLTNIRKAEKNQELLNNPQLILNSIGRPVNDNVILTRIVRRLNIAKTNGSINDYKIHNINNEYFYELM
jgi:uncharacterized membrane protein YqiK